MKFEFEEWINKTAGDYDNTYSYLVALNKACEKHYEEQIKELEDKLSTLATKEHRGWIENTKLKELLSIARFIIPKCISYNQGCENCQVFNKGFCYSVQEFETKYEQIQEAVK